MKGQREHPSLLLPLGASLLAYATGREDWILPIFLFALIVAGYWIPSPKWLGNFKGFGALLLLASGLSYGYQHLFLEKIAKQIPEQYSTTSLLFIDPRIWVTLSVLGAWLLVLLWYLPPGKNRRSALLVATFALVALCGNTVAPFAALTLGVKTAGSKTASTAAYYYLPSVGLYFFLLWAEFQFDQGRQYRLTRAPAPGWLEKIRGSLAVLGFFIASLLTAGLFAFVLGTAAKGIEILAGEVVKLYEGRSRVDFDDSMKLGVFSQFENSSEPLLSLEGKGPVSDYLRCQVFSRYQKGAWQREAETGQTLSPLAPGPAKGSGQWYLLSQGAESGLGWDYQIRLAASLGKLLPLPYGARRILSPSPLVFNPQSALLFISSGDSPTAYRLEGIFNQPLTSSPETVSQALAISEDLRAALASKAGEITKGLANDLDKAKAVARFFSDFEYSLEAHPKAGRDPVVDFVLNRRSGYCQFFASGAALLLRTAGVPTRVVTGFLIREPARDEINSWIIRRRDAHAWCEFYDRQSQRWVMIDPTPLSAMNEALGIEKLSLPSQLLDRLRLRIRLWLEFLRNFNFAAWINSFNRLYLLGAGVFFIVVLLAWLGYRWRGRLTWNLRDSRRRFGKRKKPPEERGAVRECYRLFLSHLKKVGLSVKDSETAEDLLGRVQTTITNDGQFCEQCREFVNLYHSARFRSISAPELELALSRLGEMISRLGEINPTILKKG